MSPLKIPERYKAGLVVLNGLSDETFQKVLAGVQAAPGPPKGQKELAVWLSSELPEIGLSQLQRLIDTLASLYRLRIRSSTSPETLATDVSRAATRDGEIPSDALKERLASLLAVASLNLLDAKARELQFEAEHTFCEARILTDLRPVFGSEVVESPEAMIIVQTLKLGYHNTGSQQHLDVFIALDDSDISKLIDTLKRAQDKARTLKQTLAMANIRTLES